MTEPVNQLNPSRTTTLDPTPAANPAPVVLHICEPGQTARTVKLENFPARIGRSEECDVVLTHPYVSRIQLTIFQNASTGKLAVVDHSRSGSLLENHAMVQDAEVTIFSGATIQLAANTELGAVTIRLEIPTPKIRPATPSRTPTLETAPTPSTQARPAAQPTLMVRHAHPTLMAAQPTLMTREIAVKPLARLNVHYSNGSTEMIAITALPFEIGREPTSQSNAYQVLEATAKVSRHHLRITAMQNGNFIIQNLAIAANGTWSDNEKLPAQFAIAPASSTSASGWITLGEATLTANSMAIRIESA